MPDDDEIHYRYGRYDLDLGRVVPYDGTPRVITPLVLRRPYVPAGPWETAVECGHCGQSMKGHASHGSVWLCHPDEGMDCYRLVTVYNHDKRGRGRCARCQEPTGDTEAPL